jgi:hypothetical protein
LQATGTLTPADDEMTVLAEAQGTFMTLSEEMQSQIMKDYPGMRSFFER